VELDLHFPNAPSWRGAQLKESTGTTLPLPLNIVLLLHISLRLDFGLNSKVTEM
jgi:hypothetical protein